jgi:pimeloyl-ACP methyl ester carboxylesterase
MKCKSILLIFFFSGRLTAQEVVYPHPVNYIDLKIESQDVKMAYMDVKPAEPNGKTVLLFHGKNFNGYYWKDVISFLSNGGYRVIVPDQVGWGRSSKPNIHYSFHLLADNTMQLLDSLGIRQMHIIGTFYGWHAGNAVYINVSWRGR